METTIITVNPAEVETPEENEFDIIPLGNPAPSEYLREVKIHETNTAIRQRAEEARLITGWGKELDRQQLKAHRAEVKALEKKLEAAQFEKMLHTRKRAKAKFEKLQQEYAADKARLAEIEAGDDLQYEGEDTDIVQRIQIIRSDMHKAKTLGKRATHALMKVMPVAVQLREHKQAINAHYIAIDRARRLIELREGLKEEVAEIEERIIKALARLGWVQEIHVGKSIKRKYMKIEVSFVNTFCIYMKFMVGRQTLFGGWKDEVPHGKKITAIFEEDILKEISITIQRQITGVYRYTSGAFLKVNRLGTTDGIMNHLDVQPILEAFTDRMKENHAVFAGVTESDILVELNLEEHPHLIAAGMTGSGKSTWMNSFICQLITNYSPDELRIIGVDLKGGVELAFYGEIPHLLVPIISEVKALENILGRLSQMMNERMKLFRSRHVRKIKEFNDLCDYLGTPEEKVPRVLVLIDEIQSIHDPAQVAMKKTVLAHLWQIMTKGRAAGIHVLICTQYPKAENIPTEITSQAVVKVCFRVKNKQQSRVIIDTGDAAELPAIAGRAIVDGIQLKHNPVDVKETVVKIQAPYIGVNQIHECVKTAQQFPEPRPIHLPDETAAPGLDIDGLLWYSIYALSGNLGARPLYEAIKGDEQVTLKQVTEMVHEIVQQETLTYEGREYFVTKNGRGYRLEEA